MKKTPTVSSLSRTDANTLLETIEALQTHIVELENRCKGLNALVEGYVERETFFKTLPAWKQVLYSIAKNGIKRTVKKIVDKMHSRLFTARTKLTKSGLEKHEFVVRVDAKNPKRMILVSHDMQRGGAPIALYNLAKVLIKQHGFQLQVLTFQGGPNLANFKAIGCDVHVLDLPYASMLELPKPVKKLIAKLGHKGFDKVIGNTVISGGLVALFKEQGMRVVTLVHEMPKLIQQLGLAENARQLALYSDYVVFGGQYVANKFPCLSDICKDARVVLGQGSVMPVYQGDKTVARRTLRERLKWPEDTFIVIGCGLSEPRKGTDYFAETLIRLASTGDERTRFLWIGDFCDEQLRLKVFSAIKNYKLEERFLALDFQKDLVPFFAGADLFFLSSREDPFPTVVLDAMRIGLPCLAFSSSGGAEEMLADGRGFFAPYLDVEAAADSIRQAMALSVERKTHMTIQAQTYAAAFTPERYAERLLALLEGDVCKRTETDAIGRD